MEMHLFLHTSSVHFAQPIHYSQYKPTDTRRRYRTAGEPQQVWRQQTHKNNDFL